MQRLPFPLQKLSGRAAIRVEGPDAAGFLQGLVTADIETLGMGEAAYAALLQPQGKILFEFFVLRTEARYLIDCAAERRDELLKRLGFYKLRAKLTLSATDQDIGIAFLEPAEHALRYADPRLKLLGWRFFAPAGALPAGDNGVYRDAAIRLGIADSGDIGSGELFPHEANLDQLGAVSFSKGCYVGQEVVSRMEHRGTARSRILPVRLSGEAAEGGDIVAGERPIGKLLRASGRDGLALVRLDRLKDAVEAGLTLLTGGVTVSAIKPSWARFQVAGT